MSSGLDSSFNLVKAKEKYRVALALTFDYGQKAARREVESAARLCQHFQVPHQVLLLPWFRDFTTTSLIGSQDVPVGADIQIDDRVASVKSAAAVWVPNRNGIFLNIAAGFAEGLQARYVIPGFNIEEASTFPDNSQEFLHTLDQSFVYSTNGKVKTLCFSTAQDKTQIVASAKALNLPFSMLWPCYFAEAEWCGQCESCQRFRRAIEANGMSYEVLRKHHAN